MLSLIGSNPVSSILALVFYTLSLNYEGLTKTFSGNLIVFIYKQESTGRIS